MTEVYMHHYKTTVRSVQTTNVCLLCLEIDVIQDHVIEKVNAYISLEDNKAYKCKNTLKT